MIIAKLELQEVCTRYVPQILLPNRKRNRLDTSRQFLLRYEFQGDGFSKPLLPGDESREHYFAPVSKTTSARCGMVTYECIWLLLLDGVVRGDDYLSHVRCQRPFFMTSLAAGVGRGGANTSLGPHGMLKHFPRTATAHDWPRLTLVEVAFWVKAWYMSNEVLISHFRLRLVVRRPWLFFSSLLARDQTCKHARVIPTRWQFIGQCFLLLRFSF